MTIAASPRGDRAGVVASVGVALLLLVFVAVLLRIVTLQLSPSPAMIPYASGRVASKPVQGFRGEVLDRRGRLLSTTRVGFRAFVDPEELPSEPHELGPVIEQLAAITGADPAETGERLLRAVVLNAELESNAPDARPASQGSLSALLGRVSREKDALPGEVGETADAAPPPDRPAEPPSDAVVPRALIRYVRVGGVLNETQIDELRRKKIRGVHLERCPVREYPGGDVIASIVGKVDAEHEGLLGAEKKLESKLRAEDGLARYVHDASGRPLWIERGQWIAARHGADARISIDLELQRIAHEELTRGVEHADAAGGRLVLLDSNTGEVLAMLDIYRDPGPLAEFPWDDAAPGSPRKPFDPYSGVRYRTLPPDPGRAIHPALGKNRCVEHIYEPGSSFKPFVWSVVTASGLAQPNEVIDTEGGRWVTSYGRPVADVTRRPAMTWTEVLINSSNIGMVKVSERMPFQDLRSSLLPFGFGQRTAIGLDGESSGRFTTAAKWNKYTHTSIAFGQEVAVTPLQMARAFCAFARSGVGAGTLPRLTLTAIDPGEPIGDVAVRVLPPDIAIMTREALREVAHKVELQMASQPSKEAGWRYLMFGKSGTADIPLGAPPKGKRLPRGSEGFFPEQYCSSFVAGAPFDSPRLVVVVVVDDPGPEAIRLKHHYGSWTAGPIARRVLERSLAYLGETPDVALELPAPDAGAVASR